jgi:selenide, water dikinase
VESLLVQVMAGACKTLGEAGCALVGGHTSEGAELALGFAIEGVAKLEDMLVSGTELERGGTTVREGAQVEKKGLTSGGSVVDSGRTAMIQWLREESVLTGESHGMQRKGGLRAGDALVLTKGVGTGAIFAADMRGKAKCQWVGRRDRPCVCHILSAL